MDNASPSQLAFLEAKCDANFTWETFLTGTFKFNTNKLEEKWLVPSIKDYENYVGVVNGTCRDIHEEFVIMYKLAGRRTDTQTSFLSLLHPDECRVWGKVLKCRTVCKQEGNRNHSRKETTFEGIAARQESSQVFRSDNTGSMRSFVWIRKSSISPLTLPPSFSTPPPLFFLLTSHPSSTQRRS